MRVVMLGVPFALGQLHPGVELAPQALRAAGLGEQVRALGHEWEDRGDLVLPSRGSLSTSDRNIIDSATNNHIDAGEDATEMGYLVHHSAEVSLACAGIADAIASAASGGKDTFVLSVGGDHSIALGTVTGIKRARPDMALFWVDSHGDFNTPETTESGNMHGMPVAALLNYRWTLPGFDWMCRGDDQLSPSHVVMVGIRSLDAHERRLLRESGVTVFTMKDIDRYGIGRVMEMALDAVDPQGNRPLHLSYDIDVVDPAEAPGTGTRVPGGLTYRESHLIAEMLAETGRLGSMDLVEVNPELEPEGDRTVRLGLELILSALGKEIY